MGELAKGKLELIIGNMFSGKSTELIRRFNREKSINKKIIVINYIDDNRYSNDSISTHDSRMVKCIKLKKLCDLDYHTIINNDSFFIDEGQFFSDLYNMVSHLVDFYKKHVVVSGLDGDFKRKPFGQILELIPICDTVDKLRAYCIYCKNGEYAPFTKRIFNSKDIIDIGGSDKYVPVCRLHYQ